MKTQFSEGRRYILEKKNTYEGSLPLKNSFDSKYLTILNKDPAFQGKVFLFSTHIATSFHFAHWHRQESQVPTGAWEPGCTIPQGAEPLGLSEWLEHCRVSLKWLLLSFSFLGKKNCDFVP